MHVGVGVCACECVLMLLVLLWDGVASNTIFYSINCYRHDRFRTNDCISIMFYSNWKVSTNIKIIGSF